MYITRNTAGLRSKVKSRRVVCGCVLCACRCAPLLLLCGSAVGVHSNCAGCRTLMYTNTPRAQAHPTPLVVGGGWCSAGAHGQKEH